MNPNVALSAEVAGVEEKSADYFSKFDVVVATCCSIEQLVTHDGVGVANVYPPSRSGLTRCVGRTTSSFSVAMCGATMATSSLIWVNMNMQCKLCLALLTEDQSSPDDSFCVSYQGGEEERG